MRRRETEIVQSWLDRPTLAKPSVNGPVLRPIDDFPCRNWRCRFVVGLRVRPGLDRQDGHRHRNGHPEAEREPRSGCHVRLLMPYGIISAVRSLARKAEELCEPAYSCSKIALCPDRERTAASKVPSAGRITAPGRRRQAMWR